MNVGVVWDADNRLTEVRQGPTTLASFAYDGFGRRQQKTAGGVTRTFISDQDSLIEERVSTGQALRYIEGPGGDQHLVRQDGAAVTYYLADHLGSIVQETNSAGAVTLGRKYDPWGNLLAGASAAGWAYIGRPWDPETGLADFRARYYDPSSGRFLNEDPIGFRGGLNFFTYVGGNPILLKDPFGLEATEKPPDAIIVIPPPRSSCKIPERCGSGSNPCKPGMPCIGPAPAPQQSCVPYFHRGIYYACLTITMADASTYIGPPTCFSALTNSLYCAEYARFCDETGPEGMPPAGPRGPVNMKPVPPKLSKPGPAPRFGR